MPSKSDKATVPKNDSFEAVAKRLECDPDMAKFDKQLGKITKAKTRKTTRAS